MNTGAVRLTDQELRNSIYRGLLNEQLKDAARYEPFQAALNGQLTARMSDVELVLRLSAPANRLPHTSLHCVSLLNEYMREHARDVTHTAPLIEAFRHTIDTTYEIFNGNAFRGKTGNQINKALFDTTMQALNLAEQVEAERKGGGCPRSV